MDETKFMEAEEMRKRIDKLSKDRGMMLKIIDAPSGAEINLAFRNGGNHLITVDDQIIDAKELAIHLEEKLRDKIAALEEKFRAL